MPIRGRLHRKRRQRRAARSTAEVGLMPCGCLCRTPPDPGRRRPRGWPEPRLPPRSAHRVVPRTAAWSDCPVASLTPSLAVAPQLAREVVEQRLAPPGTVQVVPSAVDLRGIRVCRPKSSWSVRCAESTVGAAGGTLRWPVTCEFRYLGDYDARRILNLRQGRTPRTTPPAAPRADQPTLGAVTAHPLPRPQELLRSSEPPSLLYRLTAPGFTRLTRPLFRGCGRAG